MSDISKNIVEFNNYKVEFNEDMEPTGLRGTGPKPDAETGADVLRLARDLLEVAFRELCSLGENRGEIRSRLGGCKEKSSFILLPRSGETSEVITRVTVVGDKEGVPTGTPAQDVEMPIPLEELAALFCETRWELKRRAFRFHISLPFNAENLIKELQEYEPTLH